MFIPASEFLDSAQEVVALIHNMRKRKVQTSKIQAGTVAGQAGPESYPQKLSGVWSQHTLLVPALGGLSHEDLSVQDQPGL